MHHDLEVFGDGDATARAGAALLVASAAEAVARRGRCDLAVSGGTTPEVMFRELVTMDVPWRQTTIFQNGSRG